jgi:hypothetical protein
MSCTGLSQPGTEKFMPVVDLSFVLAGTTIPLDHGYSLFSALCRLVPALHDDEPSACPGCGEHGFPYSPNSRNPWPAEILTKHGSFHAYRPVRTIGYLNQLLAAPPRPRAKPA